MDPVQLLIQRVRLLEDRYDLVAGALQRIEDACDDMDERVGANNDGFLSTAKIRELIGDA